MKKYQKNIVGIKKNKGIEKENITTQKPKGFLNAAVSEIFIYQLAVL